MKTCSRCRQTLLTECFRACPRKRDGLYPYCRSCASEYQAAYRKAHLDVRKKWFADNRASQKALISEWSKQNAPKRRAAEVHRNAAKLHATPAWADSIAIRAIYDAARLVSEKTGVLQHVDHIVPLRGRTVCGLHCEANLQVIDASANTSKSNRYWPDMPESVFQ